MGVAASQNLNSEALYDRKMRLFIFRVLPNRLYLTATGYNEPLSSRGSSVGYNVNGLPGAHSKMQGCEHGPK